MSTVTLELDSDVSQALRLPPDEVAGRLRRELAIRLYQKRILGYGKARALAALQKWDFHALLAEEGVIRHYDRAELERDLKTLDALG